MAKDFANIMKTIREEKAQTTEPNPLKTKPSRTSKTQKMVTASTAKRWVNSKNQSETVVVLPADLSQLKKRRVRKNYTLDPDFVEALEAYCKERKVSSSQLIEYTLSQLIGFKK